MIRVISTISLDANALGIARIAQDAATAAAASAATAATAGATAGAAAVAEISVNVSGLATGGGPLSGDITINVPAANMAESQAGSISDKASTPLGVSQYVQQVLGNVNNTSDANKPVSTAQATALAGKQPIHANLTGISGLTFAADTIPYATGVSSFSIATLTSYGRSVIAAASSAALKSLLSLVKGDVGLGNVNNTSDANKPVSTATQAAIDGLSSSTTSALAGKQPLDARLTSISGLGIVADVVPYGTGTNTFSIATLTSFGRSLIAAANLAALKVILALTKGDVGLGNVDNTSDASKPISTATQAAIDSLSSSTTSSLAGKQPLDARLTSLSAENIQPDTVPYGTGVNTFGVAPLTSFGRSIIAAASASALKTLLALVKGDVGLGNVDNTSDVNKPVSTAQTTALNLKYDKTGGKLTGPLIYADQVTLTAEATTDIASTSSRHVRVNGNPGTNITNLGTPVLGQERVVRFTEIYTITAGSSIVVPSPSIATTVGMVLWFYCGTAGEWRLAGGIKADGSAIASFSTRGKHAIYLAAKAWDPSYTEGAVFVDKEIVDGSGNKATIVGLEFPASGQKFAEIAYKMPPSWDPTSTFTAIPDWVVTEEPTVPGNNGVRWTLCSRAIRPGDHRAGAWGADRNSDSTFAAINQENHGPVTSNITPSGTPERGCKVVFRTTRTNAGGPATYDKSAILQGWTIFITTDRDNDN